MAGTPFRVVVGFPTRFDQIASFTPFAIGLRFQKEGLVSCNPPEEVFAFALWGWLALPQGVGVSEDATVLAALTHVMELSGDAISPFGESLGTTWAKVVWDFASSSS